MRQEGATAKRGSQRFKFIRETIAELKKVVWLSRREAAHLTGIVLIVSITVGLIMGIIDYIFTRLVNNVFLSG